MRTFQDISFYDFVPAAVVVGALGSLALFLLGMPIYGAVPIALVGASGATFLQRRPRRLLLTESALTVREWPRGEVSIPLEGIERVQLVWVFREGTHLEFRCGESVVELYTLGEQSRAIRTEIGEQLASGNHRLSIGRKERELLGMVPGGGTADFAEW